MTLHQLGIITAVIGLLVMGYLYTQQPRDLGSVEPQQELIGGVPKDIGRILYERRIDIEEQCIHQNKWSHSGRYGECPNQRPLAVYSR